MIRLNVFIRTTESNREELVNTARELVAASLKDEGCVAYDLFESSTRRDVLMICETWSDAKALAASQFAQYGMPSAPDDMLEGYAEKILADKDQGQKIYEKLYEAKVVEDVKSKIKVTEKAVSAEDFAKLAQAL